jgi:hypothetical protein
MLHYFDPLRSLTEEGRAAWSVPGARESIIAGGSGVSSRAAKLLASANSGHVEVIAFRDPIAFASSESERV